MISAVSLIHYPCVQGTMGMDASNSTHNASRPANRGHRAQAAMGPVAGVAVCLPMRHTSVVVGGLVVWRRARGSTSHVKTSPPACRVWIPGRLGMMETLRLGVG